MLHARKGAKAIEIPFIRPAFIRCYGKPTLLAIDEKAISHQLTGIAGGDRS
jgi:hypothetical protein